METKSIRNYGIDLLKITSVIMIIVSHLMGFTNFKEIVGVGTLKWYETYALSCIFIPFLDCFALITGYLMYKKKQNWLRFSNLYTKVLFYSVILMLISVFVFQEYKITDIIYHLIPTFSSRYWYWTAYVIVYMFGPFINKAIEQLDKDECKKLLYVVLFSGVIINIIKDGAIQGPAFLFGYSAIWLIFCYILGAIIKKYDFLHSKSTKKLVIVYLLCLIITFCVSVSMELAQLKYGEIISDDLKCILFKYNSITVIIAAICLLEIFCRIKLKNVQCVCKVVTMLSNASFGVYIIHNHDMIREKLMFIFRGITQYNAVMYMLAIVFSSIIIYVCCALIDIVVSNFFIRCKYIKVINEKIALFLEKCFG